ncbi:MAG: hypothetical protein DMG65_03210 [Candidatus Angelobacter sp. Gp1-AA117]|nr:MAG: hypothetical protein DMG65_03210 [Candidatus Angelobacter sp. Gp1-AA117]
MSAVCSIFSQILQLFSRAEFQRRCINTKPSGTPEVSPAGGQFIAMLFCQLGRAHSLTEITQGLAASEGKLKHLGLSEAPAKSTLAYAKPAPPLGILSDGLLPVAGTLPSASRCAAIEIPLQEQTGQSGCQCH